MGAFNMTPAFEIGYALGLTKQSSKPDDPNVLNKEQEQYIAMSAKADRARKAYSKIPDNDPAKLKDKARMKSFGNNLPLGLRALFNRGYDEVPPHLKPNPKDNAAQANSRRNDLMQDFTAKIMREAGDLDYKDPLGTGNTSYLGRVIKGTPAEQRWRADTFKYTNYPRIQNDSPAWNKYRGTPK